MAHYYFDSSAAVKHYVSEIGTGWIRDLHTASVNHTIYLVRISGAEIVAALFRRTRTGSIAVPDAQAAATQFKNVFQNRYQIVEVTEQLIDSAMMLAEKHTLRGYDSVQLAAALELQMVRASLSLPSLTFVSADDQLNVVAVDEGLPVENPNAH